MVPPRLTFSPTSPKRKRVNLISFHHVTHFAFFYCLVSLPLCIGCKEQNTPPLPTHKTEETKQREQETLDNYLKQKKKADAHHQAIADGVKWLVSQQAEDGGWHSQTYGNLKGGAATTALALYTISHLPEDALKYFPHESLRKAHEFLKPGLEEKGFVVCPDGTMDEPNYATALYLLALQRMEWNIPIDTREAMQVFLLKEQCTAKRGFTQDNPNYGGWDLAGGAGLEGETPGTNISITRFVTQALAQHNPEFLEEENELILAWASRVQNLPGDGGFFFHPQTDHEGNKAQWTDDEQREHARSYGTCTCDGILLLAALGVPKDDPRMQAAIKWLMEHPSVEYVPGFEDTPPELDWQRGLHFYYLMTLSEALPFLPEQQQAERRSAILEQLVSTQKSDGSWQNESARMREDDPLIATCFALVALSLSQ